MGRTTMHGWKGRCRFGDDIPGGDVVLTLTAVLVFLAADCSRS